MQVQTKYYRLLKALVDHLGKRMPPKPYKQAAIQSALLAHWDKVTINAASTAFFDHVMLVLQIPLSENYIAHRAMAALACLPFVVLADAHKCHADHPRQAQGHTPAQPSGAAAEEPC